MTRPVQGLIMALVAAVFATGGLEAGEQEHAVAQGESASAIAKKYYGSFDLTALLLAYNGRETNVLMPGDSLRIPYSEVHRVRRGDSWSELSRRYLGHPSRYTVVAELNGMQPEKPLQPGDEIVFPVFLEHRLARGETLGSLSERYYGRSTQGRLLQKANRIDDPRRLSVGTTVQVPLLDFRLTSPKKSKAEVAQVRKPDPEPRETKPLPAPPPRLEPQPPPEPPARFATELRDAREWFRSGEFERSRDLLESIRERVADESPAAERAEHAQLLAYVYVAFDRSADACAVYGSVADLPPPGKLNPNQVSPRIREVLSGCASGPGEG